MDAVWHSLIQQLADVLVKVHALGFHHTPYSSQSSQTQEDLEQQE